MRLGLVTDVHNHAAELAAALAIFRNRGVDQVVTIGDSCDAFGRRDGAGPVADLLRESGAIGVWGNHDFSLCRDVDDEVRDLYPSVVFDMMARMESRLEIDDCYFSHRESSVDPFDVLQLWGCDEESMTLTERANRAFEAVAHRLQFVGHYHRWWAATPAGPVDWNGQKVLILKPELRYFVVVAAIFEGWCGILDTDRGQLEPVRCVVG